MVKSLSIDFEQMCKLEERIHIYWYDKKNRKLGMNKLTFEQHKKCLNIARPEDIIGIPLDDLYGNVKGNVVEKFSLQNEKVLSTNSSQTFYEEWVVHNNSKLKLFTIKFPYYDYCGKPAGIFGMSYCLDEVDLAKINSFKLTEREKECLSHLLTGKTAKQIALTCDISFRTVESHIENIKGKFGCSSKNDLVKMALEAGFEKYTDISKKFDQIITFIT